MAQATLAACVLAAAQLQHHNMGAVWPICELAPAPSKMVLHPVLGGSPQALELLRSHTAEDLRTLIAAWVEAQAEAVQKVPFHPK